MEQERLNRPVLTHESTDAFIRPRRFGGWPAAVVSLDSAAPQGRDELQLAHVPLAVTAANFAPEPPRQLAAVDPASFGTGPLGPRIWPAISAVVALAR